MLFINLRADTSGGLPAAQATVLEEGGLVDPQRFGKLIHGPHLLLITHGFNVNFRDGVTALQAWRGLMSLPPEVLVVGVLWPGDAEFLRVVDYPVEGQVAIDSGRLLADFLNAHANPATTLSFASHSLGARLLLEALSHLKRQARHVLLMAGAIENDCLDAEYAAAALQAERIHSFASHGDWVLRFAFPTGNLLGTLLMHGHPYLRQAFGVEGPAGPIPGGRAGGIWQAPDDWDLGHLDYLPDGPGGAALPAPVSQPLDADPEPGGGDWKPGWTAAAASTLLR